MRSFLSSILENINTARLHSKLLKDLIIDDYIHTHLLNRLNGKELKSSINNYEFGTFSQNGEDGIIEEIFDRISTTNKFFVEFGVGDGNECNTSLLLVKGWNGLWIESNKKEYIRILKNLNFLINNEQLQIVNEFVKVDNIQNILRDHNAPMEFDLLSIDIDGNDYWIWEAIVEYKPRVVVIEYNASFRPPLRWIMKYNPSHRWDKTNYYGASLKSYEELGRSKGYSLVSCDITGTNAFFVHDDCLGEKFKGPFTSEEKYQPPRYFLSRQFGHRRKLSPFVIE